MTVTPIPNPLSGEGLVGIQPTMAPVADAGWHRRLNLFTGRALTAPALTAEQVGRAGRLAALGQSRAPGVVTGLETTLQQDTANGPIQLQIGAGLGLTAGGEDIVVPRAFRVRLGDLPTFAPAALLAGAAPAADGSEGQRQFGPTLDQLRATGRLPPPVGIVVLQPVTADMIGQITVADPCEQDPTNDSYDDWQIADGCRAVFYTWSTDWAQLPADSGRTWCNLVAAALFAAERAGSRGTPPWLDLGVPVCVVGFDAALQVPRFLDRYAVVRSGGKTRPPAPLVPGTGNPLVWQARMLQFAAQIASPIGGAATVRDLGTQFRFLPPVGLLPREVLQLAGESFGSGWRSDFFPPDYRVRAMPVPLEQLDAVARASAPLADFDAAIPDNVQLLVPVPQQWFEERLLLTEQVDPVFQTTIDQFVTARATLLQRRAVVRGWTSTLTHAMIGQGLVYPDPDPERLEVEAVAADALNPTEESLLQPVTDAGTGKAIDPTKPLDDLAAFLQTNTPLTAEERAKLSTQGLQAFIADLESRIAHVNDTIDMGFLRVQTDIYRTRQLLLGDVAATRLATSSVLASIAQGETASATRDALNQFLATSKTPTPPHAIAAFAGESLVAAAPAVAAARLTPPGTTFGTTTANAGFLSGELTNAAVLSDVATEPSLQVSPETQATTSHSILFKKATTSDDIQLQLPIVGNSFDFRTVTVAERLKVPPANEAKVYTVASKAEVVGNLANLPIAVDDLQIPGFVDANHNATSLSFATIKQQNVVGQIIRGVHDPDPADGDEAAWLSAGVRSLEATVSALRLVEGRTQAYQRALDVCRKTLNALQQTAQQLDRRLKTLGDEIARSRHDVSFARALLQDEIQRIGGINERRARIFSEHVTCVAFHRPRTVDLMTYSTGHATVPVRAIDPGVAETAVPACLAEDIAAPGELRSLVDLLRDAPVSWFSHVPPLIDRLDRLDILFGTLQSAKLRAQTRVVVQPRAVPTASGPAGSLLSMAMSSVLAAQHQVVSQLRLATAQIDLSTFADLSWRTVRDQAQHQLSLGDLMDASHGRSDVSRAAASELDNIRRIAACLFDHFRGVLPAIRLLWAERLSQYGDAVDLRALASLPRWTDVDPLDRRTVQSLADWLYGRVDPSRSDAVAMINDLVRLCILLASHAPVDEIIAGHVPQPTVAQPGGRIQLAVNTDRVRVGMHVLLYGGADGANVVGRGVVEDVSAGAAAARVLHVGGTTIQLAQNAGVRFVEPDVRG